MGRTIKEKALAKINLYLNVLGKREDQYHELEMVMAPLKLHDTVEIRKRQDGKIIVETDVAVTERMEDNIAYRAASEFLKKRGIDSGVEIRITKRIPIAAGLAGGSADCGATLRGLNRLFKIGFSREELADFGEQFGADVPYAVHQKICIARGKGEKLLFLDRRLRLPTLLITPDVQVSTRKVYETLSMERVEPVKITKMTNAIYNCNFDLLVRELHNALEPFTLECHEEVRPLKERLEQMDLEGYSMSGSGPTYFILSKDTGRLKKLQKELEVYGTTTLTRIV